MLLMKDGIKNNDVDDVVDVVDDVNNGKYDESDLYREYSQIKKSLRHSK